ncbi:MAG: diguanylate cyclase, partial [Myxococcaceae bacterium]
RATDLARRIGQRLHLPNVSQAIGVTIGAALFPTHAATATQLLQRADQAMYRAKREHLDFCLYGSPPVPLV